MRKINDIIILIIGIALLLVSYNYDQQVNLFFKSVKFPLFDAAFSAITNFGIVVLFMLALPSIILYKKNKKLVYLLWIAFFASVASAFIIKLIFLRQRPVEAFTYPFINIINYSFPSMHAMAVFSLLPILAKYSARHKYFWIGFGLFAVFSRIYLGFHYLSDVVFGALSGYFMGYLLLKLHEEKKLWR